jgi:outer membrane protein OmpA-like peptidoglycan-associated protein
MIVGRHSVILITVCAAVFLSACHPRIQSGRPSDTLVALLPDPDDGVVGRAVVSNPSGTADLDSARESSRIAGTSPPGTPTILSEADVQSMFGDVLSALPPRARHFTLYFQFESDELTAESRALVPDVLQAVKDIPFPEVNVIGHTDTTGNSTSNVELGLRRANVVRRLLLDAGLDGSLIEVTSHGEADLLVQTPDDTFEPRNRRVEISVR